MIDNELTECMMINKKYVLAHTPNIKLKRSSGGPVHLDILDGLRMTSANGNTNDT